MGRHVRVSGSFAFHSGKSGKRKVKRGKTSGGKPGSNARPTETIDAIALAAAFRMTVHTKDENEAQRRAEEAAQEMLRYLEDKFPDIFFSHLKVAAPMPVSHGALMRIKR